MLGEYTNKKMAAASSCQLQNNTMIQTRCYPSSMLCIRLCSWSRLSSILSSKTFCSQQCFPHQFVISLITCCPYFVGDVVIFSPSFSVVSDRMNTQTILIDIKCITALKFKKLVSCIDVELLYRSGNYLEASVTSVTLYLENKNKYWLYYSC